MSDEDLLDIFGVDSIALAQRSLMKALPHLSILRDRLSGEIKTLPGRTPDYVRILLFLCWMQTTKTRQRGDRDFREMLEKQTGEKFRGSSMRGLNPMWEHLKVYLGREHGIELDLPGIRPHSQIGRTLRMAFPTWRDRVVFRRLRHAIAADHLLDPLVVYNKVSTSRHLFNETMPSFEYNFDLFDRARKRGGRDYMDTPFWHAWYAIVAEQAALEDLEIIESEYGDYEIFRTSPMGDRVPVRSPEEAIKYVPKQIARAITNGTVLLEYTGFGKYRATATYNMSVLLIHRSKLNECDEGSISACSTINPKWVMVTFNGKMETAPAAATTQRDFGWVDGIRVGGALLGRTPFAPRVISHQAPSTSVAVGGEDIAMVMNDNSLTFPDGVYSGIAAASVENKIRDVVLVTRANEVGETRRLPFEAARDISEDEFNYDTVPSLKVGSVAWGGIRTTPCDEMVTLGEALYARTARGLSFAEAFELVRRGLSRSHSRPGEWDIIRTFADAGWFELTLLRNHPARRILQRPLTCEITDPQSARLNGPMPLAVVDHIATAAAAEGVELETHGSASRWSMPRYVIKSENPVRLRSFIRNTGLAVPASIRLATPREDNTGVHGYDVIGRLDEDRGYFGTQDGGEMVEGLYRLERKDSRNPFLYRSVISGMLDENFVSPTLAIMSHHLRRKRKLFDYDGLTLSGRIPRVALPSSWARWASDMVLCNAGAIFEGGLWRYSYPANETVISDLTKYVSITRKSEGGSLWIDRFLSSASNRNRRIFDARSGKVRAASGALGKRN